MIRGNNIFVFLFLGIFLISFASALDWDNVKSYDEETKTITVINAIGFGEHIARIQLISDLNEKVGLGYQKVAEFEITGFTDYSEAFKEMEFYNLRNNWEEEDIAFDYKMRTFYDVEIDDYTTTCDEDKPLANGTVECITKKDGSHTEQRERWDKITPADIKENEVMRIGIFTTTQDGDYKEWIPNFFGIRIDEWASWTAALDVDMIHYYKLDDENDYLGTVNMTINGGLPFNSGLIDNGADGSVTNTGKYLSSTSDWDIQGGEVSVSLWANATASPTTASGIWGTCDDASDICYYMFYRDSPNRVVFSRLRNGVADNAVSHEITLTLNSDYVHLVGTYDGVNVRLYVDGVLVESPVASSGNGTGATERSFIMDSIQVPGRYFNGKVDEVGIWERNITQTEITQLYNGGLGITPSAESGGLFNVSSTSDNSSSTFPKANDTVLHSTFFNSNVSLSSYIFSWNNSGSWVNDSAVSMSGTSSWANATKQITLPKGSIISWLIYGTNTESILASTDISTYIVKNSVPYIIGTPTLNESIIVQNQSVNILVNVSDRDGLGDINSVIAGIGYPANETEYEFKTTQDIDEEKYINNPIDLYIPDWVCASGKAYHTEFAPWYEDGTIHAILRTCSGTVGHFMYSNSTNGINWTDAINITGPDTNSFYGYTGPDIKKINNIYYMSARKPGVDDIMLFSSTDKLTWNYTCTSSPILSGTFYNAEIHNLTDGNYGMYVSTGGGGNFNINYYNSTDICSGWTNQGVILSAAEGTWSTYKNGKWINYYSEKWDNATAQWVISVATGDTMGGVTPYQRGVLIGSQAWENPGSASILAGSYIVEIPDSDTSYAHKYYNFYDGDQNITGVAWDSTNRSFTDVFFDITNERFNSNVTLSQVGVTSIWSGDFTNTSSYGIYNLTSVWVNDGEDTSSSTYSTLGFEVIDISTPTTTLNSPTIAEVKTIPLVQFNFTATPLSEDLTNATLYIWHSNGTLFGTNYTSLSGNSATDILFTNTLIQEDYIYNAESCGGTSGCSYAASNISFSVNLTAPTTTLNSPTIAEVKTIPLVQFNFTATPLSEDLTNATLYIWYSNGTLFDTNYTSLSGSSVANVIFTNTLIQEDYIYNAESCAGISGCSYAVSNISFGVHLTAPTVNITKPLAFSDYIIIGENETLEYSISEAGENLTKHLADCWYVYPQTSVISSYSNFTVGYWNITDGSSTIASGDNIIEFGIVLPTGNYFLSNTRSTNNILFSDWQSSIPDCASVNYGDSLGYDSGDNGYYGCVKNDDGEFWIIKLINSASNNFSLYDVTTDLDCLGNTTEFEYGGYNNITVFAEDEYGLIGSLTHTWTYLLSALSIDYDTPVYEGNQNTITMSFDILGPFTVSAATLDYDSTTYNTNIIYSGGNYIISANPNAPLIDADENITFNFYVTINGTVYNPRNYNQTILNVELTNCSPSGDLLMNMSLVEEELLTPLTGDIQINAQLINILSGLEVENITINYNNTQYGPVCLTPIASKEDYYLDAEIRYTSDGYSSEFYYIQSADLSSYPINLSLYDLNTNDTTEFLIKYQDDTLVTVEGAVVQLQRKYISEDIYRVVEAPLTSNIGTAVVHIDLNTNRYKATVVKDGVVLDFFDNIVFNCENELSGICTQNLFGDIDPQNIISLETLNDFSYSVSDADNEEITTSFSIPSGTASSVNIILTQTDLFGESSICDETIISSGGAMTCTYNQTIGESILLLEVYKDGVLQSMKTYKIEETDGVDFLGNNFFIVFILILSLVGMAMTSPEWIIVNAVITMVFAGGIWLLNGLNFVVGLGSLVWIVMAATILISKLANKEDR